MDLPRRGYNVVFERGSVLPVKDDGPTCARKARPMTRHSLGVLVPGSNVLNKIG